MSSNRNQNNRILVVDDNEAIHADFRKILCPDLDTTLLDADEATLFGQGPEAPGEERFELDSAFQGAEALEMVNDALRRTKPYGLAFVDVRMPPGWDGIETVAKLWEVDPFLQVVICTAYSDYTRAQMAELLDLGDRLLILKKPFDNVEVRQLASAMLKKWNATFEEWMRFEELGKRIREQTDRLEHQGADIFEMRHAFAELMRFRTEVVPTTCGEIRATLVTLLSNAECLLGTACADADRRSAAQTIIKHTKRALCGIDALLQAPEPAKRDTAYACS